MSNARQILIVDDDEDLRSSLRDQLALYDEFEIATASTAAEGLEATRNSHLDLILFDVGLPDMDGREAVKQLRRNGFKAPIVMLSTALFRRAWALTRDISSIKSKGFSI